MTTNIHASVAVGFMMLGISSVWAGVCMPDNVIPYVVTTGMMSMALSLMITFHRLIFELNIQILCQCVACVILAQSGVFVWRATRFSDPLLSWSVLCVELALEGGSALLAVHILRGAYIQAMFQEGPIQKKKVSQD